jgi:hypothetical protein
MPVRILDVEAGAIELLLRDGQVRRASRILDGLPDDATLIWAYLGKDDRNTFLRLVFDSPTWENEDPIDVGVSVQPLYEAEDVAPGLGFAILAPYLCHHDDCSSWARDEMECDCGLDAATEPYRDLA